MLSFTHSPIFISQNVAEQLKVRQELFKVLDFLTDTPIVTFVLGTLLVRLAELSN
jgi:hypothetical protein